MTAEQMVTTVIPILLVICIVYYNLRKIKRNLNSMKDAENNKNSGCGGGCASCKGCTPAPDKEKVDNTPEEKD